MISPLLATKLFIPPLRHKRVRRERLLVKLSEALQPGCQFTLVSAPAGFGKTTLVSEWVQEIDMPVAWLSLDNEDNNPARFWSYVLSALRQFEPEIGAEMDAALQSPQSPPLETLITLLINDMTDRGLSFILVLDDYHLIEEKRIHETLNFVLDYLLPDGHIVVLTRADPPLRLAHRRASGQMFELRSADLRFAPQEARYFLAETMQLDLSVEDIQALENRTEGWIAGLQLAALAVQGSLDPHAFVTAFTGDDRYIADYLLTEVLEQQPEMLRRFLVETAILERLTPDLCNALTGRTDCQHILQQLERDNLFIIPLDNRREWFRYHRLFAQLLRQRLTQTFSPEHVKSLLLRASKWHQENGLMIEAVNYALSSGDFEWAADLIEKSLSLMFERSELTTLQSWAESLPGDCLAARPRLCAGLAWAANATNHPELCEALIRQVEDWVGIRVDQFLALDDTSRNALDPVRLGALVELSVQRARMVLDRSNFSEILEKYQNVLPYLTAERDSQPYLYNPPSELNPVMAFTIAIAQEFSGDLLSAVSGYERAAQAAEALDNPFIIALALGHLGNVKTTLGELKAARSAYLKALEFAVRPEGQNLAFYGISYAGLGNLYYEWDDLKNAQRELERGIALGLLWDSWEVLLPGYAGMVALYCALGEFDQANDVLDQAAGLAKSTPFPVTPIVDLWRAQFWLAQGKIDKVNAWAAAAGYDLDEADGIVPVVPEHALILGRLLVARGQSGAAIPLLQTKIDACRALANWHICLKLMTQLALALFQDGQRRAAIQVLREALERAQPHGYIRTFIDHYEAMATLLDDCRGDRTVGAYAARLLASFPVSSSFMSPAATGLVEPLSRREMEILELLAGGLTNPEIAEQAYISLNTVKKHITNIYGKMGVSSRLQAVDRARQLNLLKD